MTSSPRPREAFLLASHQGILTILDAGRPHVLDRGDETAPSATAAEARDAAGILA